MITGDETEEYRSGMALQMSSTDDNGDGSPSDFAGKGLEGK
jgi:hypothetical protein